MSFVIADRVRETTLTTGTGTVTLAGAYTGFQTFSAGIGTGNSTYYAIANVAAGQWEVGIGTYTSGANTLSRTTVLASSNAGSLVNFTNTPNDVFVTQPAERALYVSSGGTGLTSGVAAFTANGVAYASSTTGLATGSALTFDGTNLGIGGSPVSSKGQLQVGTIGYTDTGVLAGFASSVAGYNQIILQNTNSGATASTNFNVSNDQASATTNYGEFGINSSGFSGSGFSTAGWTYLASASTDLAIGTYGSNAIHFIVNSGTTDAMTITSSGNVGIGTSSPSSKLEVYGSNNIIKSTASSGYGAFYANSATGNSVYYFFAVNGTECGRITSDSSGVMIFGNGSSATERMRIDSSGNVGIGTSSFVFSAAGRGDLEINGSTDSVIGLKSNGTSTGYFQATSSIFNVVAASVPMQIQSTGANYIASFTNGVERMRIDSSGNVGIGTSSLSSKFTIEQDQAAYSYFDFYNVTASGGIVWRQIHRNLANTGTSSVDLAWLTSGGFAINNNDTGSANYTAFGVGASERMRIDSSGNLLVNTTTRTGGEKMALWYSSNSGPAFNIRDTTAQNGNTFIQFNNGATTAGAITSNGTTTMTYGSASDYRLKENLSPLTGALAKVAQLQPKVGLWKADSSEFVGFIAHELQTVFPDAVVGEKDAVDDNGNPKYQMVDAGSASIIATLTAAIQELNATITDLQAKLKSAGVAGF